MELHYSMNDLDKHGQIIMMDHLLPNIAKTIFIEAGYGIENALFDRGITADFTAVSDTAKYLVMVKVSTTLTYRAASIQFSDSLSSLAAEAAEQQAVPVFVVFACLVPKQKQRLLDSYPSLIILDLPNLLFSVQGTRLQASLISLLPFSVEEIVPVEGRINLTWLEHSSIGRELLNRLDACVSGRDDASSFEVICFDLLRYVFSDDLSLWRSQDQSNMGLYRFDLLCRVKDGNAKTFWAIVEQYFHSKYVIFEFKNYSNPITQKEIYTTERYLYQKALRNVAIIVARNGFDNNSEWAAKGSLREYGKLILLITIEDMKRLLDLKEKNEDPSELLLTKMDDFLIELEK